MAGMNPSPPDRYRPANARRLCHADRDAPALTDRQAMHLRPCPDITRALTIRRSPPRPPRRCPPGPAGVFNKRRQFLAERGGVLGVQVDLIIDAVECEPDGLLGGAAGQIVLQDDDYFLNHLYLPAE